MSPCTKSTVIAIAVSLLIGTRADAVIKLPKVTDLEECPDGLTITTRADKDNKEMIEFDVAVDAEKVAHAGELYKGRVRPSAHLSIATAKEQVAFVQVQGTTRGKQTHYYFSISSAAAKT